MPGFSRSTICWVMTLPCWITILCTFGTPRLGNDGHQESSSLLAAAWPVACAGCPWGAAVSGSDAQPANMPSRNAEATVARCRAARLVNCGRNGVECGICICICICIRICICSAIGRVVCGTSAPITRGRDHNESNAGTGASEGIFACCLRRPNRAQVQPPGASPAAGHCCVRHCPTCCYS